MSSAQEQASAPTKYFDEQQRIRLFFFVKDLLPPPEKDWSGAEVKGEEMWELQELLQRTLGRFVIGHGDGIAAILQDFIMTAEESELFQMLELIPVARARGIQKRNSPFEKVRVSDFQRVRSAIDTFLETIGCPARFDNEGNLTPGGFADETPVVLKHLPGKDTLQVDLDSLASQSSLVAVIYVDLDNFKAVNDTKGHKAGDQCLEIVVDVISRIVVGKGKLYRYGGDEFVVVLPNFDAAEASSTAERIRMEVASAKSGGDIIVTTSIGVASSDMDGIDRKRLLESADEAMYVSKKTSKNSVSLWKQKGAPT